MSKLQIVIPLYPNVTHLDFTGPHQVLSRAPEAEIVPTVNAALRLAYNSYASVAVLIPQRVIGIKSFQEQAAQ